MRLGSKSVNPVVPLAVAICVVGATGVAGAATGGTFLLGKANTETSEATLSNTKGVPLSLSAPAGKAPLAVNSGTEVNNLNAQYLDGTTAGQLQTTGSSDQQPFGTEKSLGKSGLYVVSTAPLSPGTYYVTATALLNVTTGDATGLCILQEDLPGGVTDNVQVSASNAPGYFQAAQTAPVYVPESGVVVSEFCETGGFTGSYVQNAGITAIRVASDTEPDGAKAAERRLVRRALRGAPARPSAARRPVTP